MPVTPEVERFLRSARAGDVGACSKALEEDAKLVNSVEADGCAALHFAAANENLELIDVLLKSKADVDAKNAEGNTPLMLASKAKKHDAIKKLVSEGRANVNGEGCGGVTAAHHAAAVSSVPTVALLVELGAKLKPSKACERGTVLHAACETGDVAVVGSVLHDFGVDVNAADAKGRTPLSVAVDKKSSDVIQFLLEHGANPNAAAQDGTTPLHGAVAHCGIDDVKLLLNFGANAKAADKAGATAVAVAEKLENKPLVKELEKPLAATEKRVADAARFKAHGNKVFMAGENVKASRFYTLAIANDPKNHVYFSNRSACFFNMKSYTAAMFDAKQCIALSDKWPKGYFRLAATQNALKKYDDAAATIKQGLALDPNNADLKALVEEMKKHHHM